MNYLGRFYQKGKINNLIEKYNLDIKKYWSKKLLPDDSLFIESTKTLYIIEKKYQNDAGSIDEKLQTCEYKKWKYNLLFNNAKINVKYCYILCDWFKRPEYRDVLYYIKKISGCDYFFNNIDLSYFGCKKEHKQEKYLEVKSLW